MHGIRTLFLLLPFLLVVTPEAQARTYAKGFDAVTTPGMPVELQAKFEAGFAFFRPDLRNKPVVFDVMGQQLSAITDRDGVARVTVSSPTEGVISFTAHLVDKKRAGAVARARMFVVPPGRPVAVVDIDGTLSDLTPAMVPFMGARAKTFPGAPELLRDLSATHTIVYLTARDEGLARKSEEFLARRQFPDGPVLYNDHGFTSKAERQQFFSKHHGKFKLDAIRGLQARGLNVVMGIGNAETDAYAYLGAGIDTYILDTKGTGGAGRRFSSYSQLRGWLGVTTPAAGFVAPIAVIH